MEKIIFFIIGLVISGEALALLISMYFINRNKTWLKGKNLMFLISDIFLGGIIIYYPLLTVNLLLIIFFLSVLFIGFISHLIREIEYIKNVPMKFCFNLPLFIVNNLKIGGIIVLFLLR